MVVRLIYFFLLGMACCFVLPASAQVSVRSMQITANTTYLPDIAGFELTNNGMAFSGRIRIEVFNENNEAVCEIRSASTEIAAGSAEYLSNNLATFQYLVQMPTAFIADKHLGPGSYTIYIIVESLPDAVELIRYPHQTHISQTHIRQSSVLTGEKEKKKAVQFHGYGEVTGYVSTRPENFSTMPPAYAQMYLNPTLTLFDVPISAQLMLSSQQHGYGQNINSFSVDFDGDRFKSVLIQKLTEMLQKNKQFQDVQNLKNKGDISQLQSYEQILQNPEVQKELKEIARLDSLKGMLDSLKDMQEVTQWKDKLSGMNVDSLKSLQHWKDSVNLPDSLKFLKYIDYKDSLNLEAGLNKLQSLGSGAQDSLTQKAEKLQEQIKGMKWLEKKKEGYEKLKQKKEALEEKLSKLGVLDSLGQLKDPGKLAEKFDPSEYKDPEKLYQKLQNSKLLRKFDKVLYYIRKINLGTSYPRISELALNNQRVNGINVEITPKKLFASFTYGDIQDAVISPNITQATYRRKLTTGTFGYGDPNASHFYMTILTAKDDTSSVNPRDSIHTFFKLPQENHVISAHFQLSLWKDRIRVSGELAGSQTVRDITMQNDTTFTSADTTQLHRPSDWFVNILGQRKVDLNTVVDFAVMGKVELFLFKHATSVSGSVKRIGPDYRSFGVPFLLYDILSFEGKITQKIWKNRIALMGMVRHNSDNLTGKKLLTTSNIQFGFEASVNIPKGPRLRAGYIPVVQSNDSTQVNINVLNVNGSYSFKHGKFRHMITGAYIMQDCLSADSTLDFQSHNVLANYLLTLPRNITVNTSANYIRFVSNTLPSTHSVVISAGTGFTLFKRWSNQVGGSVIYNFDEVRYGFYYQGSVTFLKVFTFTLRLEQNQYNSYITNSNIPVPAFTEFSARGILGFKW